MLFGDQAYQDLEAGLIDHVPRRVQREALAQFRAEFNRGLANGVSVRNALVGILVGVGLGSRYAGIVANRVLGSLPDRSENVPRTFLIL